MKILHYIYGLHVGGAETFIVNALENLGSSKYTFEFAIQDENITNPKILDMLDKGEIKVHYLPKFHRKPFTHFKRLSNLIESNGYDSVHIHINAAVNPIPLIVARKLKGKSRFIVHSHNSSNNAGGIIGKCLHYVNSRMLINQSMARVACSDLAGRWMFGNKDYTVIDNAVNVNSYRFSEDNRKKIRNELCIPENAKVIGSVGRFVYAKNHKFMIEFFAKYSLSHPDAVLLLVGTGPLFDEIKSQVHSLGLDDKVVFTGLRTDIPEFLSAMDCFFFPSHFEGLGFVAVEAEATGLYVVASNAIPNDIDQGGYVRFLSLNDSVDNWATAIDDAVNKTLQSDRVRNPIENSRFDIKNMISNLDKIYKS